MSAYRDTLKKYMKLVVANEGTTFLHTREFEVIDFDESEWEILKTIADELEEERV